MIIRKLALAFTIPAIAFAPVAAQAQTATRGSAPVAEGSELRDGEWLNALIIIVIAAVGMAALLLTDDDDAVSG